MPCAAAEAVEPSAAESEEGLNARRASRSNDQNLWMALGEVT
jgi:hypothetical protein